MDGHVFAYSPPRSTEQRAYTQARIAQLAAQRREQRRSLDSSTDLINSATRSRSHGSTASAPSKLRDSGLYRASTNPRRDESGDSMEAIRANSSVVSLHSLHPETNHPTLRSDPFELRHGRRYLRDLPYPLPCDLAEIQRQNLRTLLGCKVFGKPFCSPNIERSVPVKVLELGCGSGYWSGVAHDYFCSLGHPNVSFTGLDAAPVAADLRKQGVDWHFVQHDIRRRPWPFDDDEFDLIMVRDLSLAVPMTTTSGRYLNESIRILREGGTLEIWDSDLVIRSLLPGSLGPAMTQPTREHEIAEQTATFLMAVGAPFAPARNKHLVEANAWIADALDRRHFSPTPCARIAQLLIQEPDLESIGVRRVAIPLGELQWEREAANHLQRISSRASAADSAVSMSWSQAARKLLSSSSSISAVSVDSSSSTTSLHQQVLTPDQLALRQTALITVLQMIESFEPLLREVSGKNAEEWSTWWASMMAELTDPARANLSGECLELGVWWATKTPEEDY